MTLANSKSILFLLNLRGNVMSNLFDDLREGLKASIDYEKGLGPAKKATYDCFLKKKCNTIIDTRTNVRYNNEYKIFDSGGCNNVERNNDR